MSRICSCSGAETGLSFESREHGGRDNPPTYLPVYGMADPQTVGTLLGCTTFCPTPAQGFESRVSPAHNCKSDDPSSSVAEPKIFRTTFTRSSPDNKLSRRTFRD